MAVVPEGDTVWLAAQRLHGALGSSVLVSTDFRVPRHATTDLGGRTVREVVSRGKHILTRIDDDLTLHTHFRMDGTWHLYRPGRPWRGGPDHEVRVVLRVAEWTAVGYRLPVVALIARTDEATVVGHLGPDLLGPDWDAAEAIRRLSATPDREIGPAMLDQRNLAGIGNLYKTELCFLLGVTPWTPVRDVDLARLVERAHSLLRANRDRPEQVTTGERRPDRSHWVFERRACLRCGTRLRTAAQGQAPYARLSSWCPRCQHGPAPVRGEPAGH